MVSRASILYVMWMPGPSGGDIDIWAGEMLSDSPKVRGRGSNNHNNKLENPDKEKEIFQISEVIF